jgi:asparaginyl-tRNA synthetase
MVTVSELDKHIGKSVKLCGWVYNSRSSGKLVFIVLRDGTGLCQCVAFKGNLNEELFNQIKSFSQESSVEITGIVKEHPKKKGVFELDIEHATLVGESVDYPISLKDHGVGFLMSNRHLWLRSQKQWATLRIRARLTKTIRDFLDNEGFLNIDAPCLTPSACEGTTTLFETDYFGKSAYLSQSGQLYNEATASAFGKVYCFGPVFRAEKSKTRRHLIEFWQVEPEAAFMTHEENMTLQERFLAHIVSEILSSCSGELEILERNVEALKKVVTPFPRITYTEAIDILKSKGSELAWGSDFGAPDETILSEMHDRPLIIEKYPTEVKAFYMKRDPENPKVVLCDDIIAPEGVGEIIGGSQREDNLSLLEERIKEHGLEMSAFEWYLDLRRYGGFPHSGFGLGIERMVGWLAGSSHVREAAPFPRMLEHIYP